MVRRPLALEYLESPRADVDGLLAKVRSYLPLERVALVEEAYRFAAQAHAGQRRESGGPFIEHPLATGLTVAELGLDASAVAAALLHDVMEDCGLPRQELEKRFSPEVARLAEGVTKLTKLSWRPGEDALHAENLRKMFLAMAEDPRVVIIKLADRLHNMRTIDYLPPEDRRRISQETMEIYAPLAGRLGITQFKWELEDLSFRQLQPERYREVADLLASKRSGRERYLRRVERILQEALKRYSVQALVQGRAKHIFSVHQKMERYKAQGKSFHEIYDLLALRVLADSVADCYTTLGVIHGLWKPIPGQFDDYIANARGGVYQSLHSTVLGPTNKPLEVQIRTHEMHRVAEYGLAAHWRYKEGVPRDIQFEQRLAWLRQLLNWQRDTAEEFVEALKTDVLPDQVFVFTPKGDVKDLPTGSTSIDFAFRIHTEVGYRCIGARVNGRLVPLNYQLQNGDVAEILTSKAPKGPSRDWLNPNLGYIRTSHAREKVRAWFKRQERAENVVRGREMLEKELHRLGTSLNAMEEDLLKLFPALGGSLEDLLATVGYGGISTHQIALKLAPLLERAQAPVAPSSPMPLPQARPQAPVSVRVLGGANLLTNLARCCNPLPGDPIIGYITRGRGVTVHRRDCQGLRRLQEGERLLDAEWGPQGRLFPVAVRIEAWDRLGLLRDISTIVAFEKVNMTQVRTQEHEDRSITIFATLETMGLGQLTRVLDRLEAVRGVVSVSRADGASA